MTAPSPWWRTAVVYEVYLRSFCDGSGDGVGDLAGLRRRLPHLVDLGVDAVWVTPWYPSPMADGGYDVSSYTEIDPVFGTLEDADALLADVHAAGLRLLVDLVANHTSEQHPWFRAALAAQPGDPARDRYFFRDGAGDGSAPPNDWISAFGGPAWTRVPDGQWYLHTFAPEQPDLDWADAGVQDDMDDVLRFWLDRGVDGIRVDAAPAMAKQPGLPPAGHLPGATFDSGVWTDSPHWDVAAVHDILRRWRRLADAYDGDRVFVAEAVVSGPERLSRYVRPDEMHTAFGFDFLRAPWDEGALRRVVTRTLEALGAVGAPATWVLSTHDDPRHVTRFGRADTAAGAQPQPSDVALGTRRARAAALLALALPGGAYVYQGEELGLPEVEDLPEDALQDPTWERSGHTVRGRDGCRVPLPWEGDAPPYGFAPDGVRPWLPQPPSWRQLTVQAQTGDPGSVLTLYRTALRMRRELLAGDETFAWVPAPAGVLAFDRPGLRCVVNLSPRPVPLDGAVLLASAPGVTDELPADTAAWLRRPAT